MPSHTRQLNWPDKGEYNTFIVRWAVACGQDWETRVSYKGPCLPRECRVARVLPISASAGQTAIHQPIVALALSCPPTTIISIILDTPSDVPSHGLIVVVVVLRLPHQVLQTVSGDPTPLPHALPRAHSFPQSLQQVVQAAAPEES